MLQTCCVWWAIRNLFFFHTKFLSDVRRKKFLFVKFRDVTFDYESVWVRAASINCSSITFFWSDSHSLDLIRLNKSEKSQFHSQEVKFESELNHAWPKNTSREWTKKASQKWRNDVTLALQLNLHERVSKKQNLSGCYVIWSKQEPWGWLKKHSRTNPNVQSKRIFINLVSLILTDRLTHLIGLK